MPTYEFHCHGCGHDFEGRAPIGAEIARCTNCGGGADRQFSPNRNIVIPGHFRMDAGWNNAPGSTGEPWSRNNSVHTAPKTTFKQEFDKNWKAAGGS